MTMTMTMTFDFGAGKTFQRKLRMGEWRAEWQRLLQAQQQATCDIEAAYRLVALARQVERDACAALDAWEQRCPNPAKLLPRDADDIALTITNKLEAGL